MGVARYNTEEERLEAARARVRAWREKNREKVNRERRELRKSNPELIHYRDAQSRKRSKDSVGKAKANYREKNRMTLAMKERLRRYSLTPEGFETLLISQNYRCAICRIEFDLTSTNSMRQVHVDHDDVYGIRGLLCINCNLGIGNLKHDPFSIKSALKYMHRYV